MNKVNATGILLDIGVQPDLKGFKILKEYIENLDTYRDLDQCVTYLALAKETGDSSNKVERAIRHAIQVTFKKYISPDKIKELFGNSLREGEIPKNSKFMSALALYVDNMSEV